MSYFDDNEDRIIYGRQFGRKKTHHKSHGTPAPKGSALAAARIAAHSAFDPLWQSGKMTRHAAYGELARRLGIPREQAHMQMMDLATCQRVVELFMVDQFDVLEDEFKELI